MACARIYGSKRRERILAAMTRPMRTASPQAPIPISHFCLRLMGPAVLKHVEGRLWRGPPGLPRLRLSHQLQRPASDAFVRQGNREPRAFTEPAIHVDLAVVGLHDPGDEAQSETKTLLRTRRRAIAGDAIETV